MTTLPATATPRRRVPPVVGVAMLCVVGAVAAASLVLVLSGDDGASPPAPAEAPAAPAGARLPTSFGSVSVDSVVRLTGSARPMGLDVPAGRVPVQVGLTVTNVTDAPVRVDRALISLSPAAPGDLDAGRLDGEVPPLSSHRIVLRAAVADGAALPQVLVRDPARDVPLRAALGAGPRELSTLDVSTHNRGGPRP